MSPNRPIRFAVVGLGMGSIHCEDLMNADGCELAAVCDGNTERRDRHAAEYGVRGYAVFDDLLRDPEVDVVNICTPSGTHADLSVQALNAGKHVVCEKPPDVSVAAVDRMIEARQITGKQLMVIFQSRFEPLYIKMRETIQAGRLGRLAGLHGSVHWWRPPSYFDSPGKWKGTWGLDGGGSLANQGVHTADVIQWLGGPVTEVYGRFGLFAQDIESEDKTVAVLTFANGALGTLTTTTAAYPGLDRTLTIHGSRGSIEVVDDELTHWRIAGETQEAEIEEEQRMLAEFGRKTERASSTASDPFAFAKRLHRVQFEAMAEALKRGETPPNSIETTRHTVEILNAVYESGRTGQPVLLSGR